MVVFRARRFGALQELVRGHVGVAAQIFNQFVDPRSLRLHGRRKSSNCFTAPTPVTTPSHSSGIWRSIRTMSAKDSAAKRSATSYSMSRYGSNERAHASRQIRAKHHF